MFGLHGSAAPWLGLVALLALLVAGAARADRWAFDDVERVVAVGDVHGACDGLKSVLRGTGIIDERNHWRGGKAHLVSLGDLLDRGPASRCAMDLLMALEREAPRAGGAVHVVLGNHEVMVVTGDRRYVSEAEYAAFGSDPQRALRAYVRAFSREGRYGRWLLEHPVIVRINDTVFLHGGASPFMQQLSGPALNRRIRQELRLYLNAVADLERLGTVEAVDDMSVRADKVAARLAQEDLRRGERALLEHYQALERALLFHPQAPFWYRGTARNNTAEEQAIVDEVLTVLGARRMVLGHTPTADHRIHSRFGGEVLLIDTGMLASVYEGRASAVELTGAGVRVYYADEGLWTVPEVDALDEPTPAEPESAPATAPE